MKTSIYNQVTSQIIDALEAGVKPWKCPWARSGLGGMPRNLRTQNCYSGMNVLLLWMQAEKEGYSSPYWLTFKQALELGGCVRKGEKGTAAIFYKMREVVTESGETEEIPVINCFKLFNLNQIEGIEVPGSGELPGGFDPIQSAEDFISNTGAQIREHGEAAFYQPSSDIITMPERERFASAADYYATALHELTHWTGHKSRCARDMGRGKGKAGYAFEELVAELGAAFTMATLGIEGEVQHESYIASWLEALKNDKKFIFKAASQASKAAAYLAESQDCAARAA